MRKEFQDAIEKRNEILMRGFVNEDNVVGKRIEKITEFSIDPLVLTFTDGTYMVFGIEEVDGNGPSICRQSYRRLSKDQMVEAGILTKAQGIEYQEALDVIAAHEKERHLLATRNERLKQYEELKNEFEPQDAGCITSNDGCIGWGGGTCPVSGAARVWYACADGSYGFATAEELRWEHVGAGGDIIKYRVVK